MIVVDASVLANALADDGADGTAARARLAAAGELAAPDLVDVEAVAVLRKRWIAGDLTGDRFSDAVEDLGDLAMTRYPALPLMRRAFELRDNVTAYDATYLVVAAENESPLVTRVAWLAEPAEQEGATFTSDALDLAVEVTGGYPYFIQELGYGNRQSYFNDRDALLGRIADVFGLWDDLRGGKS